MLTVKKFTATWCGPCRMLTPVLNEIKQQFYYNVKFEDIDIDSNPEIVKKYGVISVPTIVLEVNGKEVRRIHGVSSKMTYVNAINENLV